MTKEQAKIILQSRRPGGEDDNDPLVAQAIALAQSDPVLRAWWASESAVDAAIRGKLKQSSVPANLAEQIIAARRARPGAHRFSGRRYFALAAAFLILGVLVAIFLPRRTPEPKTEFAAFREDMGEFLKVFPSLDLETEKMPEARAWLAQKPWLSSVEIPTALQRFPTIGCRELQWKDKRAVLICFMVDGEVIHLFVLPGSAFPTFVPGQGLELKQTVSLATAAWRRGDAIYLAATKGERAFLEKYVGS
jgi:hypothetical protein